MHRDRAPQRHVVGLVVNQPQLRPFVFLEDDQWHVTGAAVDASTSDLEAPRLGLTTSIEQVTEAAALPEPLTYVADGALHMRLIFWMPHPRWIQQEADSLQARASLFAITTADQVDERRILTHPIWQVVGLPEKRSLLPAADVVERGASSLAPGQEAAKA